MMRQSLVRGLLWPFHLTGDYTGGAASNVFV